MQLGDRIELALSSVGMTKARIERWVGGPCGCQERQEKLNQLGVWAARLLSGRMVKETALAYLERWIQDDETLHN